jgi:hypothetical protein
MGTMDKLIIYGNYGGHQMALIPHQILAIYL